MNAPPSEGWTDRDRVAMSRALQLAERGLYTTDPNPRVGCVLMHGDDVVGEGWHERTGGLHAEAAALRMAGQRARGATAYVSLEPCDHHGRTPPCSLALIEAGVAEVVYALRDPDPRVSGGGDERLRRAGVRVRGGLMAAAAADLNAGYIQRLRAGRPLVRLKLAMSLDGRTALASGESRWITGEGARQDVQYGRARSSAVLTGVGTVLADDPSLGVRLPGTERQPWRVVLDSHLRTPDSARVLEGEGRVLILAARVDPKRKAALEARGAAVEVLPEEAGHVALVPVLERLAHLQMNEVWVEAGARLAGAFIREGLFDELLLYVAPSLLGSGARALCELPLLSRLDQRTQLEFTDVRQVGPDLRITARPIR